LPESLDPRLALYLGHPIHVLPWNRVRDSPDTEDHWYDFVYEDYGVYNDYYVDDGFYEVYYSV
jgi:hypothetical protein